MTDMKVRQAAPSDCPPEDLKKERDAFIQQFFRKGAQFTEELLKENERLRERIADLEHENGKLRAHLASDEAIRDSDPQDRGAGAREAGAGRALGARRGGEGQLHRDVPGGRGRAGQLRQPLRGDGAAPLGAQRAQRAPGAQGAARPAPRRGGLRRVLRLR
ncbi:MAG: hypothetical protein QM820_29225 [Minicystis sp.]